LRVLLAYLVSATFETVTDYVALFSPRRRRVNASRIVHFPLKLLL
jgi:hypothetical protein